MSAPGAPSGTAVRVSHLLEGPPDAPVVALAGSLGTTLAMWDEQARALSGRYRVLRYDHRGHGGSPVPAGPYSVDELGADFLALLDMLELERVSLCGLSLGGMVGMWVASQAPERVERLALCCTSARLGPGDWHARAAKVRAEGTAAVADLLLERWFTPEFRARRPKVVGRLRAMLESTPAEGYAGCCEAIAELDLRDRLAGIRAPTLIVGGRDDPATPTEEAEGLAAAIPGSRLAILEHAAHLASVERPREFGDLLAAHLAGDDGAAAG